MNKERNTKKKKPLGFFIVQILYLIAGGGCGIVIAKYASESQDFNSFYDILIMMVAAVIMTYAIMFVQIALHEAGHLFFGLKSGYTFVSYRIGSFIWVKTPEGIKFRRFSVAGTGGQCLLSPPDLDENGLFPVMLYNLGGSIFDAGLSAALFAIYLILPKGTLFSAVLCVGSILCLTSALANGIPLRLGDINNDGYNALNLAKDKVSLRSFWLQLKINALSNQGVRYRDMPDEYFISPAPEEMDSALTAALAAFIFERQMDMGDLDSAREYGQYILQNAGGLLEIHRRGIEAELGFIEIISGGNQAQAEEYLTKKLRKILAASTIIPSSMRIMYAYEKAYGSEKKAEKYKKAFYKSISSYPSRGEAESETELFALIK